MAENKYELTVIIPVYNEAVSVHEIIKKVRAVPIEKQIIIVDDGSSDGSDIQIKKYENDPDTIVLFHTINQGKGSAIRTAIPHVAGEITIIQDSDLETEPNDYLNLIEPIRNNESNVVYGSRILGEKYGISTNPKSKFYLGGKFVTWFANMVNGTSLTDVNTCYKMMRSEILKDLKLDCKGFEFCTEVNGKLARRNESIVELPMHYFPRSTEEGKKLQVWDGVIAIFTILKYRFSTKY